MSPNQEISLNLLAISVFLLTLSTLVGPLFHISALWPVGLVVALWVVASGDSFFNQGRLASLIVDKIARRDPAYAERIAYHEAGHFLIAQLADIEVIDYALTPWQAWQQGQDGKGGVTFAPPPATLSRTQLEAYCRVWMAGMAAENLQYGNQQGGSDDRQKLRGMLTLAGFRGSQLLTMENQAARQARQQLLDHRPHLDALAIALQEGRSLDECRHLIAAPHD
jgi:hypothetical protein